MGARTIGGQTASGPRASGRNSPGRATGVNAFSGSAARSRPAGRTCRTPPGAHSPGRANVPPAVCRARSVAPAGPEGLRRLAVASERVVDLTPGEREAGALQRRLDLVVGVRALRDAIVDLLPAAARPAAN